METIIYRGQKYHRNPDSKRLQHRVYFWKHDKWKAAPVALHRQIWIDSNGPIPRGYVVHHKDGNTLNNCISNFELLSPSAHAIYHTKARRVEKTGICETCKMQFRYFSIRKAKFCSYKCYSRARWIKNRIKLDILNTKAHN
jgi:hypothetical protein